VEINLRPIGVFPKPIERGSRTSDQVGSLLVQGGASGGMGFSHPPLGLIPNLSLRDYRRKIISLDF
jgi:hypothetical protein